MSKLDHHLSNKIAMACNILALWGHGDFTVGHVSGRNPEQPYLHMKGKSLGLEEVTSEDIIVIDFDGNKLEGTAEKHSEFPIHTEIYRKYPDTNCVIHTHPFYSIIVASSGKGIKAISNAGVFFVDIPTFEETTMMIESTEMGRSVACCLNGHRALLMRNHGVLIRGNSIEEATVHALLLETAAKFQVFALQAGISIESPRNEILNKRDLIYSLGKVKDTWDYCVRKVVRSKNLKNNLINVLGAHFLEL